MKYERYRKGRHRKPSKARSTAQTVGRTAAVTVPLAAITVATAPTGTQATASHATALKATSHDSHQVLVLRRHHGKRYYRVRRGDSLSLISQRLYGSAKYWPALWWSNRHIIKNPNVIEVGQRLWTPIPQHLVMTRYVIIHANALIAPPRPPVPHVSRRHRHHHVVIVSGGGGGPGEFYGHQILTFHQIEDLWVYVGGPGWAEVQAANVAECESGGNVLAWNPSGATGVFQILGAVLPGNLDDPVVNARNAVSKFHASGDTWAQWVCKP